MTLDSLHDWGRTAPSPRRHQFADDFELLRQWNADGQDRIRQLPPAAERSDQHRRVAHHYRDVLAETRGRFAAMHGNELYARLTNNWTELVRVEDLIYRAAEHFPGLVPTELEIHDDATHLLRDKQGLELSQGMVLGELLAIPRVGRHLMAAMRQPKSDSLRYLSAFHNSGELDLGTVKLVRKNKAGHLTLSNTKFLNAEDDALNAALESAVDLVLLDPGIEVGVIRGGLMDHEKYRGRRVFCSGVNLTKLYVGKLSYMFFVLRELGPVSKIFRGLLDDRSPCDDAPDRGFEKPWISVVDSHAIGGGCQLVLVSDHVIAESGAYFTIPARTEGFVPGLANLRLPRYTGQRLANRMIYYNHKVIADSSEGRLLVDDVVDSNSMNEAIDRAVAEMCGIGRRGIISNRKAFRHGAEPLDVFRTYMATFCQEQARCMYDAETVNNLERFWIHRRRHRSENPRAEQPGDSRAQ